MNEITNNLLNNLSEAERNEVLNILGEISNKGSSNKYNNYLYKDYEEIPVDIETFLKNKRYLGKSFVAVLIGLYELYRILCLKDPYLYYGLQPIDKISFAFMNITLDASKGVAWDKMQQLVQTSEWFIEHGNITGTVYKEWSPNKRIELIAGSLTAHILGRAVFFAFFDEISFQKNQDVETQKQKARALVSAADARMQSRFMKGDKNPTILVLASSKSLKGH